MNKNFLSIIIPVLNEENQLNILLESIREQSCLENEIIFVDGGSTDNSIEWLKQQKEIKFIQTSKGKAHQQNKGAKIATSEFLYFLHADSNPPKGFDQLIMNTIKKGEKAGCFRLKFSPNHWALNLAAYASRFNNKFCRGGDQSLFIQKKYFLELNGFNEEYVVCEDGELIDRIYKKYSFCIIPQQITTSSRRFIKNGVLKLQFHFMIIHLMRALGFKPGILEKYYSHFVK
jgi:rSAM/selenodomain-associated transferase 2